MASIVRRVSIAIAIMVMTSVVAALAPSASAQTDAEQAERAAREIADARARANQAAEEFFAAESRLDYLLLERLRLEDEYDDLVEEVAELEHAVEVVAVDRFVSSGASGIPILTDLREPTEQIHGHVLATVVTESGATTLDDYEAARQRMLDKEDQLDSVEDDIEQQKRDLLALQADAESEVERLREIEAERLENEAVVAALAAQQAEEVRKVAEVERRQAEAARVAAANAGSGTAVDVSASSSDANTTGNLGASGGEAGGRTGGGGAGTNPRAAGVGYVDAIICPVQGGSAYGDTWGAPRSGGRRHQGVDMIAPTGTPLQAVISGTVAHRSNRLGGITASLIGDNGNRYYYAHLVGYEGPPGRVEQGQVIGYVGDTGNATGIPHLHFEIRPNHGVPVNPYPSVRAANC